VLTRAIPILALLSVLIVSLSAQAQEPMPPQVALSGLAHEPARKTYAEKPEKPQTRDESSHKPGNGPLVAGALLSAPITLGLAFGVARASYHECNPDSDDPCFNGFASWMFGGLSSLVTAPLSASLGVWSAGRLVHRQGTFGRTFGRSLGVTLLAGTGCVLLGGIIGAAAGWSEFGLAAGLVAALPVSMIAAPIAAMRGYLRSESSALSALAHAPSAHARVSPSVNIDPTRGAFSLGVRGSF
jgi:hypothetical protein